MFVDVGEPVLMMAIEPIAIIAVIIGVVLFGLALGAYNERKRREAVRAVAEQLGLEFYQDGDPQLIHQLSGLPLFSKGRGKRISNMIHGATDEVTMGVFDYRYTVGSGKNSRTYRQSVAFFRAVDLQLPEFELRPQSFFHGIGKMFGYQDIDFESHPKFSKTYLLRGPSESAIRRCFDAQLLTELEQQQAICVEGRADDLVFYRHTKRVRPEQYKELMAEGFKIFSLFRREASN